MGICVGEKQLHVRADFAANRMIRQPATRGFVPTTIHRCGLSLGSNLGDRLGALRTAAQAVGLLADFAQPVLKSAVYESEAIGCDPGTASFLNAVMEIGYFGEPETLLSRLRALEVAVGRSADRRRNEPRTLDLDLLYANSLIIRSPTLELPHPRLTQRRFVLVPLAEIRPSLVLPGQSATVSELCAALSAADQPLTLATHDW